MNPRQRRFCEEYLLDLNATQAAIRAGYSNKTARSQAERLLTKVDISMAIENLIQERKERTQRDADEVIHRLWVIVEADVRKLFNEHGVALTPEKFDKDTAAAVAGIEYTDKGGYKVRLNDRLKALERLGKHLGMFTDKVEVMQKQTAQIVITLPDNGRDDRHPPLET